MRPTRAWSPSCAAPPRGSIRGRGAAQPCSWHRKVIAFEAVGLLGYHAGPGVHILDPMALTNPLLARLPADEPWRIGHFRRPLPSGYVRMLESCVARAFPGHAIAPPTVTCVDDPSATQGLDRSIAREYERIVIATQRPLLDGPRLALLARGGLTW